MPYIKEERRDALHEGGSLEAAYETQSAGELNYCFTMLAGAYWAAHPNYQGINDIIGALEGAKMEFYRRVAVPYEDKKIQENGDVY